MPTALEGAIDALSNPGVALKDALRGLYVVSRRIEAEDLTAWLRHELNGYPDGVDIPKYRDGSELPIELRFEGPMNSSFTQSFTPAELPKELAGAIEGLRLGQPIAELEELTARDGNPHLSLPLGWVARYRTLANEGKAPRVPMMTLSYAAVAIPRTYLVGVLDRIKSTALDLALSLEDVSVEVGAAGGPTVTSDPRLESAVSVTIGSIFALGDRAQVVSGDGVTAVFGDGANVASAQSATATQINVGDIEGLLLAAGDILQPSEVSQLSEAIRADGGKPGTKTRGFLDRVRSGASSLVDGVAASAAYEGLVELLGQAFPGF
jgi:hypothetical protein